jgi:cyclophilin family peptidyl-prolyl cis-trans isomerase
MKRLFYLSAFFLLALAACKKENVNPEGSFTFANTENTREVKFTGTGTNVTDWTWDFGDGKQGTGQEVTHAYDSSGVFTVTLMVKNGSTVKNITNIVRVTDKIIEIKTSFGNMYMWLYDLTPKHKANFLKLAGENYFDSTTFHRIIQNFVIQGGDPNSKDSDPTNDGEGGPNYTIPAEFNTNLKHIYGAVGAARLSDQQNPNRESNASQYYIVVNAGGTPNLNNAYTVFGFIMKGMDIATNISKQAKDANDRPLNDIRMDVNILLKTKAEIKAEYGYTVM